MKTAVFKEKKSFSDISLAAVKLSREINIIEDGALCGSKDVKEFIVPEEVEEIGAWAFYGCLSLDHVKLPDKLRKMGENAFLDTAFYNDDSNWLDGVLYLGDVLIKAREDIGETYYIKSGTKIISEGAFRNCALLERVLIPDTVTQIGEEAFEGCSAFKAVYAGVGTAAEEYAKENGLKFIAVEFN